MPNRVLDPVTFAELRFETLKLNLPLSNEVEYARESLVALASLSGTCPLFYSLKRREQRRYYRYVLDGIFNAIACDGFVETITKWSNFGNLFLHSFRYVGTTLTYEWNSSLTHSPLNLAMIRLLGLTPGTSEFFELADWIYNWHIFLAKIPLTRPDLLSPSLSDWLQRQADVTDASNIPLQLIDDLRLTLAVLYDDVFDDNVIGRHGPGSTNLGIKDIAGKEANYVPSLQSHQVYIRSDRYDVPTYCPLHQKWMAVPKDIKSVRPITMESVSMQFVQQSLKRQLYSATDSHNVWLGKFVKFADQTRSQRLALLGSSPKKQGDSRPITVDCKSASDLISAELVALVLPPALVHKVMCARSWYVDYIVSGKVSTLEVSMFAGMGSALTFPIQTMIFTGLSVMATVSSLFKKQFGGIVSYREMLAEYFTRGTYFMQPWVYFANICIYGDDIIVPEIATEQLFSLLERFGLRVNYEKSFFGDSAVREACGIFALAGRDITPVRYRVPVHNGTIDSAVYESIRLAANLAFERNRFLLNRFYIRKMKRSFLFISGRRQQGASFVFEEYRGRSDYIGWISMRKIQTESKNVVNAEGLRLFEGPRATQVGFIGQTKTKRTNSDELYYLEQALFKLTFDDVLTQDHGKIPRGIRIKKRTAYRKSDMSGWAWSPV